MKVLRNKYFLIIVKTQLEFHAVTGVNGSQTQPRQNSHINHKSKTCQVHDSTNTRYFLSHEYYLRFHLW